MKILNTYKKCAKQSFLDLKKSWILIPASIATYILYSILIQLFGRMGFAGGMVLGFVQIALLALYYGWLTQAHSGRGLTTKNIAEYDYQLFFDILSVAFIIFIAQFLLNAFAESSPDLAPLPYFFQLGIVFILNSLPEVIYIKRLESVEALTHAAYFTKKYWIEWLAPYIIVLIPIIYVFKHEIVSLLAVSDELLPIVTIVRGWEIFGGAQGYLYSILGLIVGTWYMLFRAHLFKELD